jgi:hypothetical protein
MFYSATLKTRKEIERTIPDDLWGWWKDVCAGHTLTLRDATAEDLARCILGKTQSKNPKDYLCETFDHGCLVARIAVKELQPLPTL